MDIFTDEYVKKEIDFMALPTSGAQLNGAKLGWKNAMGRLDDYLNVNLRVEPMSIPYYGNEHGLWMSVTPMEVQSMVVPIARGSRYQQIALGGLGMGYIALRLAASEMTRKIDIYEMSQDCIDLFKLLHSNKCGFGKFNFILGDCREKLCNKHDYDFVYIDTYQSTLPNEVLDDIGLYLRNNRISEYRYWGQELAFYVSAQYGSAIDDEKELLQDLGIFTWNDGEFFRAYAETDGQRLRPPVMDGDFCDSLVYAHIEAMGG